MSGEVIQPPRSIVSPDTIKAMLEVAAKTPSGAFVEVGVYQGGTAWHLNQLAVQQSRPLYLYDTFTGIPHKAQVDSHLVGDFQDTDVETVRRLLPQAIITQGVFPQSALAAMDQVAFVHLDCDQYQSYAEALSYLQSLLVPGGVVWCDDVPCLAGATAAVSEFVARTGRRMVKVPQVDKAYVEF